LVEIVTDISCGQQNVVPDIFKNEIFAMKGGTAINLFVQDKGAGLLRVARKDIGGCAGCWIGWIAASLRFSQ